MLAVIFLASLIHFSLCNNFLVLQLIFNSYLIFYFDYMYKFAFFSTSLILTLIATSSKKK